MAETVGKTIVPDIKMESLAGCLQQIFGTEVEIGDWQCEPMGDNVNFTTVGLFRVYGFVCLPDSIQKWSLILKIAKMDSLEKDDQQHHNYWRREAHIFGSGILADLPDAISAPVCYAAEEQEDGTVWLWMEEVRGKHAGPWSQRDYALVAERLGRFNGAYLTGKKVLPDEPWICRSWLRSWVKGSRYYAPSIDWDEPTIHSEIAERMDPIRQWFATFNEQVEPLLTALEHLPRVLAHQDLSQPNMFIQEPRITWIDWQFMSISGVGEDLGKLYGVNMSLGHIPEEQYAENRDLLFDRYVMGLQLEGWPGDPQLARFGYCAAVSLRTIWEVPQHVKLLRELDRDRGNQALQQRSARREKIFSIQMAMGEEALAYIYKR